MYSSLRYLDCLGVCLFVDMRDTVQFGVLVCSFEFINFGK